MLGFVMIKRIINKVILLTVIVITISSCVDEIPLETESFESVLVIEATITNENIQQEILLSRSYMFDSIPKQESGATVVLTDDAFNSYTFSESAPGNYRSQISFAAQPNRNYKLNISTTEGKQYSSTEMQLTQSTTIDNLYVERDFNENGIEGVSVYVDSYDLTGNSKYYRHEYEETYKIIAPSYSPYEMISNGVEFPILPADQPNFASIQELVDFLVTTQLRPEQQQICYNTVKSNTILTTNTNDLLEDNLNKYRVRFVGRDNSEIMYRYSILVRQFVQSLEAHTFYETLKTQSLSENVFSETQPGFLVGNVFSQSNSNEKVVGFFEVSSVDAKRVYFNYSDLFFGEELPPYYVQCDDFFTPDVLTVDILSGIWTGSPLVQALNNGFQYFDNQGEIPYRLVLNVCGDCTNLGSNEIPDFWEE
ncbi:MAG: hypothetical protein DA407_07705 [Bacteroidetes bacterium]|nr:MAG: hypothetical protein DA407_07705 [Bacteroidota bacterium]